VCNFTLGLQNSDKIFKDVFLKLEDVSQSSLIADVRPLKNIFNPLDAKPFSLISAKGFLVKFAYREVVTFNIYSLNM
jgi:hypothetical protein